MQGCQPYPFARCDHHTTGSKSPCPDSTYMTPKCLRTCDNSSITYKVDLIHGKSGYRLPNEEKQIQMEILKNGPVVAGFEVYSDFIHYKSGKLFIFLLYEAFQYLPLELEYTQTYKELTNDPKGFFM